jgi:hypothetical protein
MIISTCVMKACLPTEVDKRRTNSNQMMFLPCPSMRAAMPPVTPPPTVASSV